MNKIIKAKPTTYRGIRFRSKMEAQFAVAFDLAGHEWEYEPEKYRVDWWLPDFLLTIERRRYCLRFCIECKPKLPTNEYLDKYYELSYSGKMECYDIPNGKMLLFPDWHPKYKSMGCFPFVSCPGAIDEYKDMDLTFGLAYEIIDNMESCFKQCIHYRFDLEDEI